MHYRTSMKGGEWRKYLFPYRFYFVFHIQKNVKENLYEKSSKYFGIGENKLRNMADIAQNPTWVVQNGCRRLIKRVLFEKFLLDAETI